MEEEPNRLERIEFVSGRVYTLAAPRRGREWYRRGGPLATGGLRGSTGCRHRFLLTVSRVPPILTGQSCISVVVRSVRVRLSLSLSLFFSLSLSFFLFFWRGWKKGRREVGKKVIYLTLLISCSGIYAPHPSGMLRESHGGVKHPRRHPCTKMTPNWRGLSRWWIVLLLSI